MADLGDCYTSSAEVQPGGRQSLKFGDFKLDCDRFELYRGERSLKLERKPMELLVLLAARNGNLVTRTEIAEHLWDREVYVDTEHGINTAVRKIREVLRDDPVQSRFVQTVTGKGYRFVGAVVEAPQSPVEDERELPAADAQIASALPNVSAVGEMPSPNSRLRVWLGALGAAAILTVLVLAIGRGTRGLGYFGGGSKISSLAVLPLDNLTGDLGQEYVADGMTDELTTMLAKNSTLRVISRTSVMQYKGVHRPLPEIARELGVDGVLEGSVSRSGDKTHMTIQLIQASNDAHVWAESYDRDANDLVSLPRQAAQTIAKELHSVVPQPVSPRFVSPEAHDAYLRGRYLWFKGRNDESGNYFKKATELQPDYALGWSGLSNYYGAGAIEASLDPREALPQQRVASSRAIELDDSLPEAHLALGATYFLNERDWVRANHEIDRAIELDPGFAEAYHFRAKMFAALQRNQEAVEAEKKASELEPFQRIWALTLAYYVARQYDAALSEALQKLESNPHDETLLALIYQIYRCQGKGKEATDVLEKRFLAMGDEVSAASVRHAFEQGGYPAVVRWQLAQAKKKSSSRYVSPVSMARLSAQLGNREEALTLLEEGYREHSPLLLWIQNDPAYDFLHSDERYRSIIKGIGLPAAY